MRQLVTPALALTALVAAALAPRLARYVETEAVAAVDGTLQGPQVASVQAAPTPAPAPVATDVDQPQLQVRLDRDTALAGGLVRAELTVVAPTLEDEQQGLPTDVVLVLDRSGSMSGGKLDDAKTAAQALAGLLGPGDRVAVVSFSDGATVDSPLGQGGWQTVGAIAGLRAGGGTEMQAGLDQALSLVAEPTPGRARRVILLSDGQPNTRDGLPALAQRSARLEAPLTTVGIGDDYDVQLMQQLADAGTGNFYWARQDMQLASVFANEFDATRAAVTSQTALSWTPTAGVDVVDVGGLPVDDGTVQLGQLFSGQRRSLWVTLRVDAYVDASSIDLGGLALEWTTAGDGDRGQTVASLGRVGVTHDRQVALAGLDEQAWAASVVEEEYNGVLTQVQAKLSAGDKAGALQDLERYQQRNAELNAHVQSTAVIDNLAEVEALQQQVQHDQVKKRGLLDLATKAWSGRRKGQVYGSMPAPRPRSGK